MIVKPRNQSLELKILRSLNARIGLTTKEETYYSNLEKGYKGELRFDEWIENASHDRLVLNDHHPSNPPASGHASWSCGTSSE